MSGGKVTLDYLFSPVPEDLSFDPGISDAAVRVYAVLMRHGMRPDNCFPGMARIGALVGKSARSVPRILNELERAGWITKVPRYVAGRKEGYGYHVHITPEPRNIAREERAELREEGAQDRAPNESKGNQSQKNETAAEPAAATPSPKARNHAALEKLPKGVDAEDVQRLCLKLRARITEHHPQHRQPRVTPNWVREMGTLLNSGPKDTDGFTPTPDQVGAMIDMIFDDFAEPQGRRAFCWADQVKSPEGLRNHWVQIEQARATAERAARGSGAAASTDVATGVAQLEDYKKFKRGETG